MKWSYVIIILQTVIEWRTHWYICIVNLDWVHILFCLMCQVETDHTLGLGSIPHDRFLPWRVQSDLAVWLPFAGRCYRSVVKDWGTTCNLLDTILQFIRHNQVQMQVDQYRDLMDHPEKRHECLNAEDGNSDVRSGGSVVLPSTHCKFLQNIQQQRLPGCDGSSWKYMENEPVQYHKQVASNFPFCTRQSPPKWCMDHVVKTIPANHVWWTIDATRIFHFVSVMKPKSMLEVIHNMWAEWWHCRKMFLVEVWLL